MVEALRRSWRDRLFSFDLWTLDRHREGGIGMLDGVWLEPIAGVAPYGAYFKPTCKSKTPAAAREKIAADLAFDLEIPAVPVLLCDSKKRFGAQQDTCCVSLVTHPVVSPWHLVLVEPVRETAAGQALLRSAPEPLSRIAVFDMWIDNRDREGNIVFAEDPLDTSRSTFCALDHDVSMGGSKKSWQGGGWDHVEWIPFPDQLGALLDKDAMLRAAERIGGYPEDEIGRCVDRIPDRYMDSSTRKDTLNGLIGRRTSLSALVLQHFEKG